MKRLLSVIIAVMMVLTTVSCAFTSFAETTSVTAEELELFGEFTLGRWPQSAVTDPSVVSALGEVNVTLKSYGFTHGIQYPVPGKSYKGLVDFQYADFYFEGERYRKVVYQNQRPSVVTGALKTDSAVYYFKWEPIIWTVCGLDENDVTAITQRVIDGQPFSYALEGADNDAFLLRWFNEVFFAEALTVTEQGKLAVIERFGEETHIGLPIVSDFNEGGLLDNYLKIGYAEGYATLMSGYYTGTAFQNRKVLWNVASDDGSACYCVDTAGACNSSGGGTVRGVRPLIRFEKSAVFPGSEVSTHYTEQTHIHYFLRPVTGEYALAQPKNCTEANKYYHTCLFCDAVGGEVFTDESQTEFHTPRAVQSDAAFKCFSTQSEKIGVYYFTCSVCGEVINKKADGSAAATFTKVIEHEHDLYLSYCSQPTCAAAGKRIWKCTYNCGYSLTESFGEEKGHYPIKFVSEKTLLSEATDELPARYYYSCARCGAIFYDQTFTYSNPEHAHEYVKMETREATCENASEEVYRCRYCGMYGYGHGIEEALGHDYKQLTHNEPTCNEEAQNQFVCQNCGVKITRTTPALGHDFALSDEVYRKATCQDDTQYYYICNRCGAADTTYYTEPNTTVPHAYAAVVSEAALCTPGTQTALPTYYYTCPMCGIIIKDLEGYENLTFKAGILDHEHVCELVSQREATCIGSGMAVYKCKECDYTYKEVFEKLGHIEGEIIEETPATCETKGSTKYYCLRCERKFSKTTQEPLGHDFTKQGSTMQNATCTENAVVKMICSRCDCDSGITAEVENSALGHDFVLDSVTEPTCVSAGVKIYTCSRCGISHHEAFGEATGTHNYRLIDTIEPICTQKGIHIYECASCGGIVRDTFGSELQHLFVVISCEEPTCTDSGVLHLECERCGIQSTQTIAALGHEFSLSETVEPGCGTPGLKIYRCSRCQAEEREEFAPPAGEHDFVLINTVVPTCVSCGIHIYRCQNCGKVSEDSFGEALGHDYVPEREPAPTCMQKDIVNHVCSRCGDTVAITYPKTEHDYSVRTDTLLESVNCLHHNIYALACSMCHKESTTTDYSYEDDAPLFRHVYGIRITDKALCTPGNEESDSTYYFTCERCGTVIKDLEGYETYVFSNVVMEHEHDLFVKSSKEPTCTTYGSTVYQCKTCRYNKQQTIAKLGHLQGELISHRDADCEYAERNDYLCERCGKQFHVILSPKLGHDYSVPMMTVREAGCTENAQYYMRCSRCGMVDGVNVVEVEGTALGHNYVLENTVEPTCLEAGCKEYRCTRCQDTYREVYGESNGAHVYQLISVTEPTCTQQGVRTYACKYCSKSLTVTFNALGHDYQTTSQTEATCTNSGMTVKTCLRCGSVQVIPASALGHDFVLSETMQPTCTQAGIKIYLCSRCEAEKREAFGSPAGHSLVLVSQTPATCTENGSETYVCSNCEAQQTVVLAKIQHEFVLTDTQEPSCVQSGSKTYTCSNCAMVKTEVFGSALGHDLKLTSVTQAGCTRKGARHFVCSRCALTTQEELPALGHSFVLSQIIAPTCESAGKKIYTCERCGEVKEEIITEHVLHDYVLVSKTEPTCPNNGIYLYECTVCGDRQTEILPAIGHDFSAHSITVLEQANCQHGTLYYAKCVHCGLLDALNPYEDSASRLRHEYSEVISDAALRTPASASAPATYYYTCALCGTVIQDLEGYESRYFEESTSAHEHNYVLVKTQEPTCTSRGVKYFKCNGCGSEYQVVFGTQQAHRKGELIEDVPATCTSEGYRKYACVYCGELLYETGHAPQLGHDYSVLSEYLYQEADCTHNALYYAKCSRCGTIGAQALAKQNSALGHVPVRDHSRQALRTEETDATPATYYYTCSRCFEVLKEDKYGFFAAEYVSKALADYPQGATIEFGRWPQSLVSDAALITDLSQQPVTMFDYGFGYGYDSANALENYPDMKLEHPIRMAYGDIVFGGEKYRKVVLTDARVHDGYGTDDEQLSNLLAGIYFFKWEPIVWTVLENAGTQTQLISNVVLDSTYHYRENWEYYFNEEISLADIFGELAFSENEKEALFNENSIKIPDYYYITGAQCENVQAISGGYEAKLSDYARLLSSDATLGNGESEVYGNWLVANAGGMVNDSEFYALAGNSLFINAFAFVDGIHLRAQLTLKNTFVPSTAENVECYAAQHTHSFARKMLIPSCLKQRATCESNEMYYYLCACCGAISEEYYELEDSALGHIPVERVTQEALKKAASENNDAMYYYTCETCGEVLKQAAYGTFTVHASHLGEHRYALDKFNSTASCDMPGILVYKCSICGETYTQTVEEAPGHNWVYYSMNIRSAATETANVTYYKVYKCSLCDTIQTDTSQFYEVTCESGYEYHKFIHQVAYQAPTCTRSGSKVMQCKYCDLQYTYTLQPLGHEYIARVKNGFTLLSAATCGHDAVYNFSCIRCGQINEDVFTDEGSALEHNFSKKVMNEATLRSAANENAPATYYFSCILCGEIDKRNNHYFSDVTYQSNYRNTIEAGGELTFGSWPQTKVTDSALIAQLESVPVTMTSFGYRYTPSFGEFYQDINMSYADITLEGATYRKVFIGDYRPRYLYKAPVLSNTYQHNNGYDEGNTYWFKWEPITWKVLAIDSDKATLVSSNILDARLYTDDYEKANSITWAESAVRTWLNESFYSQAFTDEEKADILSDTALTLNHPSYGTSGGENTIDKVRLLSYEDISNRTLSVSNTTGRKALCSDYTAAQGIWQRNDKTADWMTRSPSVSQRGIVLVSDDGGIEDSQTSSMQVSGVRPVISLSLNKGNKTADVNGDGGIDISDISLLLANITYEVDESNEKLDLNENAVIDNPDLAIMLLDENYGKLG